MMGKRAALKWHRRAGKDSAALHCMSVAMQQRVGVYMYMLPTLRQGRKVIWENIDSEGRRMLDAFPGWDNPGGPGVVEHIRHDEMCITLKNGSRLYITGSDSYDAVVGSNPVAIVMSEFAIANPAAWSYFAPILSENNGWAVFIWTPRGHNHASDLYDAVESDPRWFTQTLTVDDTQREDGTAVITEEAIQLERDAGMDEAHIQQEYYCSESAPLIGSYWGEQLTDAERDGRITNLPHDTSLLTDTWWDIGYSDATAIWFVQHHGGAVHVIDYEEANGNTPAQDVQMLNRKRDELGYTYGRHIMPHDGGHKTKASHGRALSELYGDLGVYPEVQPRYDVQTAITRVRQTLPRCWFDSSRTAEGLDALRAFRKKQDEVRSTPARPYYLPGYVHDWSSHGSSAFYTGCMTHFDPGSGTKRPRRDRYSSDGSSSGSSAWAA